MACRRSSIVALLLLIPIGYLAICALLYFGQDSLVFVPTRGTAAALDEVAKKKDFLPWTNAAGQRIGWKSAGGDPNNALLIFNGNGGNALMRTYYQEYTAKDGNWKVFLLEYPGYGAREGQSSEKSLTAAALEAFDLLAAVPNRKVWILGESLGSGVACAVAAQRASRVAGLILVTPYDRLTSVGQGHYPWLPVTWLLRTRFDSIKNLQNYPGPVAIAVAGADTVVPPERARGLYDNYPGRKRLWSVPHVNHDVSGFLDQGGWQEIVQWLQAGGA